MSEKKEDSNSQNSITTKKRRTSRRAKRRKAATRNSLTNRIASNHIRFAKNMHKLGYIHALHGLLDGGVAAYGGMKFFFDVLFVDQSSSSLIHDWLHTPEGLSIAIVESMAFAGLSLIANTNDEDAANAFKRATASFWPYCRSAVSELKKTSRGVSNTLKVVTFFKEGNLNHLMMPLGLTVGAISVLNRVWFRRMQNQRKVINDGLQALLKELSGLSDCHDLNQLQTYYQKIPYQSQAQQKYAYLSAAYTGLTEGIAFYIGILTFISFTSPAFIPMAVCCIAFTILSIATRIHEEYEYQRALEVDILIVKLRLKQKKLSALNALAKDECIDDVQYELIYKEIIKLGKELDSKAITFFDKALKGMKNGLTAYSFINKIIFGATIFFSVVPISLAIGSVVLGVFILFCAALKAVIKQSKPLKEPISNLDQEALIEKDVPAAVNRFIDELIQEHLPPDKVKSSRRSWFEVSWAFFSGLDKGRKNTSYLLMVSFAEMGLHEDYQQSSIMINLSIALGVISSIILSLRTYVLNFGADLEKEPARTNIEKASQTDLENEPVQMNEQMTTLCHSSH